METRRDILEKYVLNVYKNTSSKSIWFELVSDLLLIFFGSLFFLYAKYTQNLLSSIFFALSIVLGFVSVELDKHIVTLVRIISETVYLEKDFDPIDEKHLTNYAMLSTICNIVAGVFGTFGLFFLLF